MPNVEGQSETGTQDNSQSANLEQPTTSESKTQETGVTGKSSKIKIGEAEYDAKEVEVAVKGYKPLQSQFTKTSTEAKQLKEALSSGDKIWEHLQKNPAIADQLSDILEKAHSLNEFKSQENLEPRDKILLEILQRLDANKPSATPVTESNDVDTELKILLKHDTTLNSSFGRAALEEVRQNAEGLSAEEIIQSAKQKLSAFRNEAVEDWKKNADGRKQGLPPQTPPSNGGDKVKSPKTFKELFAATER